MKFARTALAAALGLAFCGAAFAQAGTVQRDVNQQNRIEQGLKSGQLTTREAARLENEQARIEQGVKSGSLTTREAAKLERGQARDTKLEARAGADGNVNAREQRRIQKK